MSWRIVIVTKVCKLSYKNDSLVIRGEEIQLIHLSEINTIIVENGMATITSFLVNELAQRKIKLIFCDEKHNPSSELIPYYNSYNTSKKVMSQIAWSKEIKNKVWGEIIRQKIYNQSKLIVKNAKAYNLLNEYVEQVEDADITNREGHAAKVYFNALFGHTFNREAASNINAALDYGYTIILSAFNRDIISKGYITQLGINHKNEYNQFNLSCDLMEPYRVLVDRIVKENNDVVFDKEYKHLLVNVLNDKIKIDGKQQYVSNAISIYVQSVFDALEGKNSKGILNYEF